MSFKLKFWGVRGSIACPSAKYVAIGGNTSCVEIACGGDRIIFDCGTGIRNLGHWMLRKNIQHAHIMLSHTHWDHINGFPFFSPLFRPGLHFTIRAGHLKSEGPGIREVMAGQMNRPFFPVPLDALKAQLDFEDFKGGDTLDVGRATVRTCRLNHPDGATGYRVDYRGRSVCYITDTEHVPDRPDENILALVQGADLMIYDCTYTDREFPSKVGWGHSTWQEGVRLCRMANVKRLAIFHHDPDHDDQFLEKLESEARFMWDGAFLAREGMRVYLSQ